MIAVQLFLLRALFFAVRCIPVRLAGAMGAGLCRLLFYVLTRNRRITEANLKRVYPDKSRAWRRKMARESFAEVGRTAFEAPHVFLRSQEFLLSRITVSGAEVLDDALAEGKGVFIVAAHHSNWELESLALCMLGYDFTVIYHPMKNPAMDAYLKQCRTRFGGGVQSRHDGLRWLPKALKQGKMIGVVIDQHMSTGIQVPFMGHLANTTALPASYIQRKPTPVIAVVLNRVGVDFQFELHIQRIAMPTLGKSKDANTYHMMQSIGEHFATIIHERPELWMWLHRRWYILEQDEKIAKVIHGTP